MGLNTQDACNWLKSSPAETEIADTLETLKKRYLAMNECEQAERQNLYRVIQLMESAIEDLSCDEAIHSYKELLEIFDQQDVESDSPSNDQYVLDPSPLVNDSDLSLLPPLSDEQKKAKIAEIKEVIGRAAFAAS